MGCFQFFAIKNSVCKNILTHISWCAVEEVFGDVLRIAGFRVYKCSAVQNNNKLFSKVVISILQPRQCVSNLLDLLQHLIVSFF